MMLKVERWKLALSNFYIQNFHQISINFSFVDAKKKIHVSSVPHSPPWSDSWKLHGGHLYRLHLHWPRKTPGTPHPHRGKGQGRGWTLRSVSKCSPKCPKSSLSCDEMSVMHQRLSGILKAPQPAVDQSTEAKFHGPFLTGSPLAPPWCADKLQTGIRENGELKRM